ncbi:hypothetical protein CVT25_012784 [Psilocybe cyanescens]|uniref:Uncharacterized protein n=1 Tax=Psilocybe cyanescens TaxID=93625 RepID=A0A409X4F4_PSICY|nr:hypothetical protein CVT25_012784 [Psilocybe cyanescens]
MYGAGALLTLLVHHGDSGPWYPLCPITLGEPDHIASTIPGIVNNPGKPHLGPVRTSTASKQTFGLFNPVPHNPYSSPPPGSTPSTIHPPPLPDLGYGAYCPPSVVHPASPPHHAMLPAPSPNPLLAPSGLSRTPGLQPQYNCSAYDMNNAADDVMMDSGDMPLLHRNPSTLVSILSRGGGGGGQQFPGSSRRTGNK